MLMWKRIKKIVSQNNALWACIAVGINSLINFFIIPYVTENIGVEAYGFVTLANTFVTYVDIISVALNAFACRFIAIEYHRGNYKKANLYYSSIFFADLILEIVLFLIGLIFIPNLQKIINISASLEVDVKILFLIVMLRYILVLMRNAFEVSTFIKNRIDLTEKFRTVSYILQVIILLFTCIFFKPHVWYVGLASLLAAMYLLVAQMVVSKKIVPELRISLQDFSWSCVKDFFRTGIWNALNNVGNLLNSGLDLLIANKMLTEIAMGMISVSKTLGSVCYTLVMAVSNSFRPKQLESYSKGKKDDLIGQLKFSMKLTGAICAIIIAGFYACGSDFLRLWVPTQDTEKIYILCMLVLLSDIMIGVVNPLYYVFTLTKRLKLPCYITLFMGLLNVISMVVLIKYTKIGLYAVVLTTMIINCFHFVDTPLYASYCLNTSFQTFYPVIINHLINIFINVVVMNGISNLFPKEINLFELMLKILVLGSVGGICSFIVVASRKEKRAVFSIIKEKIYKR